MFNSTIAKTLFLSTLFTNCVYAVGQCYTTVQWESEFGLAFETAPCTSEREEARIKVCDISGTGNRLSCTASAGKRFDEDFFCV